MTIPISEGLAVSSSLSGGVSDFLGGTISRRVGTLRFMVWSQALQLVVAAGWLVVSGASAPSLSTLGVATLAALGLTIGLTAFFEGMVVGKISVVAPLSATGVVIPVVASVALNGAQPTAAHVVGIAFAVIGSVLVAGLAGVRWTSASESGIGLSCVAALGGGVFLWLVAPASRHDLAWTVFINRAVPTVVLGAMLASASSRVPRPANRRELARMVPSAALAFAGLSLYAGATVHGDLAVVSVLGTLYPTVTVVLARRFLHERLTREQQAGLVGVLLGVALLAN